MTIAQQREQGGFVGRRYVVTGSASGIGMQVVCDLLAGGASVLALDTSESVLPEGSNTDGRLESRVVDVTDAELVGHEVRTFGAIHGVVAAAGITGYGTVVTTPADVFAKVLAVNLGGIFNLAKAALPGMVRAAPASFVAIASQLGLVGAPGNLAYCAAKGGVINMVRALALDHAADGIRANVVCPGPISTPMLEQQIAHSAGGATSIAQRVPLQRIGTSSEVAGAVTFLLGPGSSYMTGSVVTVDGGYSAQ